MNWLLWLLVTFGILAAAFAVVLFVLWRRADAQSRRLIKRIGRLSFRHKLALAVAMARDQRIPSRVRLIPPLLVLYLALPIDIIPDFLPVIGQLDDVVVVVVGVGLLMRFTPRPILEEHLAYFEALASTQTPPRPPTLGPG